MRDVDLDLPEGARVAVTGASGSGKSTLAAVLLRLLDPAAGRVLLGGVPITELAGDDVRRRIGLLGEHDHVFTATLRANLLLAAPDADDDRLLAALRRVRLGGWVEGLVEGLDTVIGPDSVSGGERRRLAAARLVLAAPDVLVLDEPTEGLDAGTAEALMADLLDTSATVLLLTHRREGLDRMDEVLRLEDGRLVGAVARASGEVAGGAADLREQRRQGRDLVVGEPGEPEVDGRHRCRRLLATPTARVGDLDEGGALVGGVRAAAHQLGGLEAVDDVGDRGRVQLQPLAHEAHRQGAGAGEAQQHERLVAGEGQLVASQGGVHGLLEDLLDPEHAGHRGHRGRRADPGRPNLRGPGDRVERERIGRGHQARNLAPAPGATWHAGAMIVAFSVAPSGPAPDAPAGPVSDSVSEAVAAAVRVVRESGLPHETSSMFTSVEGEWDEVMDVVKRATEAVGRYGSRVSLVLKADIRPGWTGQIAAKVARVEEHLAGEDG